MIFPWVNTILLGVVLVLLVLLLLNSSLLVSEIERLRTRIDMVLDSSSGRSKKD